MQEQTPRHKRDGKPLSVAAKLIQSHLVHGAPIAGEEIGIRIDQTLTQDATGTLVMLELEAMRLKRVRTQLSVQYVDHNLLQTDSRNPDDHVFLRSACQRYGIWFSPAGNGVSHPVHMERFGIPGKTLLGADSHTPAGGALGMLAIGAGGLEVAQVMAGEPLWMRMPAIWGVRLSGALPPWVSAKDVVLEMLRRHDVDGAVGKIIEYYGPGLASLSAMDRHVIANMGTELGATTSVFPSDHHARRFLAAQSRADDWVEIKPERNAHYDVHETIELDRLEPLVACPSSPGNVVPVREVVGREVHQVVLGSSANPGLRDFAVAAWTLAGRRVADHVSFDVNPTSRQLLENLAHNGYLEKLVRAGARVHQAGCNGCIGMGQAPATNRISLRTVPRNFPGRSGTVDDQVYLCSPETAAASALTGVITDPRDLDATPPHFAEPRQLQINKTMFLAPPDDGSEVELEKGPNIKSLPEMDPLPPRLRGPVLLKVGDHISTDEILPAGARVLPFRSNIEAISRFTFAQLDPEFHARAQEHRGAHASFLVAGSNYGQGSSREHAALAPRFLGVRIVLAHSFARIHEQNLVNFGILPLRFADSNDYESIEQGDTLEVRDVREALGSTKPIRVHNVTRDATYECRASLSPRQVEMVLAGWALGVHSQSDLSRANQ